MKKALLLLTLCVAAGSTMAQVKIVAPNFNLTNPQLNFKADSSWRTLPKLKDSLNTKTLKRLGASPDLNHLFISGQRFVAIEGYKMPIAVLNDASNMPVKKIDGFANMPVVGSNMPKPQKLPKVNP